MRIDPELSAAWVAANNLPEAQWHNSDGSIKEKSRRHVTLTISEGGWYANIHHEKGYIVWYMPGNSPQHALEELVRALNDHRGK